MQKLSESFWIKKERKNALGTQALTPRLPSLLLPSLLLPIPLLRLALFHLLKTVSAKSNAKSLF